MRYRIFFFVFSYIFASSTYGAPAEKVEMVGVVAQLYRDFAWEAVIDDPEWKGHSLLDQSRQTLERYFDQNVARLIFSDRECAAKTQEICKLDFSPIWASQDPGATEMKIVAGAAPDIVTVRFRYPGDGDLLPNLVRSQCGVCD